MRHLYISNKDDTYFLYSTFYYVFIRVETDLQEFLYTEELYTI